MSNQPHFNIQDKEKVFTGAYNDEHSRMIMVLMQMGMDFHEADRDARKLVRLNILYDNGVRNGKQV